MQKIALVNQKGGVGKTTTAINLAAAIAAIGKKALLIDLDPQGNASTGLGISASDRQHSVYQLLFGLTTAQKAIKHSSIKNLDVICANVDLAAAELELKDFVRREYKLAQMIDSLPYYDYVIVDCPPSLGLLTINALCAVDQVIIPMQCEFYSLEGLAHLLKTLQLVHANYNPRLNIFGIVLTMYDARNKLSEAVRSEVKKYLSDKLFATVIPRNIRLSEAPSHGTAAIAYDHTCKGSIAYIRLAKEILLREVQLCRKIPA
jgi:chromosome partitioning protein